jgi:hypothetical protein
MRSCCVIADLPHAAHWSYAVFPELTQVIQALSAQRTKQLRTRCVRQWHPELGPEDSNTNSHQGGRQPWRIDAVRTAEDESVTLRFRKDFPNLPKGHAAQARLREEDKIGRAVHRDRAKVSHGY